MWTVEGRGKVTHGSTVGRVLWKHGGGASPGLSSPFVDKWRGGGACPASLLLSQERGGGIPAQPLILCESRWGAGWRGLITTWLSGGWSLSGLKRPGSLDKRWSSKSRGELWGGDWPVNTGASWFGRRGLKRNTAPCDVQGPLHGMWSI